MKAKDSLLLVLTGTITPSHGAQVERKDPELRRRDYLHAFEHWLAHSDERLRRIVFIENSGADLADFKVAANQSRKEVEIISIPPNPPPPEMHYGYSELQMLDLGLAQSRLRQATTHMVKATGRLLFPDISKLLDKVPEQFRAVVDSRSKMPFRNCEGKGFITTQLFLASHELYDEVLRKSYLSLAKAYHYPHFIEYLFYDLLTPLKGQPGITLRFPLNCEPQGFAGHDARQYHGSDRALVVKARAFFRVLAPGFWI